MKPLGKGHNTLRLCYDTQGEFRRTYGAKMHSPRNKKGIDDRKGLASKVNPFLYFCSSPERDTTPRASQRRAQ